MPMKLNVGLARKVSDNNFGSRGASVNLEIELDAQLATEPAKLQERIRQLFGLARASLAEELNGGGNGHAAPPPRDGREARPPAPANVNGRPGGPRASGARPATPNQKKAIYAIARNHGIDLGPFLRERFGVARPDDLTAPQASDAIDALKAEAPAAAHP